jgi:ABC-2 type transport system permease protein
VIARVAKLIGRTQLTKGRLAFLLAMGGLALLLGFAVSASSGSKQFKDTIDSVSNGYGLHVFAPIVALVLASAALGDLVDDRTLVYLWLRPVQRWQIAVGAAIATLGTAVPVVVVPMVLAAAIGSGNATAVGATAAATTVATHG